MNSLKYDFCYIYPVKQSAQAQIHTYTHTQAFAGRNMCVCMYLALFDLPFYLAADRQLTATAANISYTKTAHCMGSDEIKLLNDICTQRNKRLEIRDKILQEFYYIVYRNLY